jgi:hypothetical protein
MAANVGPRFLYSQERSHLLLQCKDFWVRLRLQKRVVAAELAQRQQETRAVFVLRRARPRGAAQHFRN